MSAGLPGLGLGGLFFIFSALLAPFPELWRTLRGRSDLATWKAIGRQLAQALAMIGAIDLTLRLTYVVLSATGAADPPAADEATVLPLNLIGITTGLLLLVLCGSKLAELALRVGSKGLPRVPETLPRVAPVRAVAFAAAAAVAWIALLAAGASELSPLERPGSGQIASRPEQDAGGAPQPAAVEARPAGRSAPSPATKPTTARSEGAGTPSGTTASGAGGGSAGIAPSPAVAVPKTPPSEPTASAPVATPEPKGPRRRRRKPHPIPAAHRNRPDRRKADRPPKGAPPRPNRHPRHPPKGCATRISRGLAPGGASPGECRIGRGPDVAMRL